MYRVIVPLSCDAVSVCAWSPNKPVVPAWPCVFEPLPVFPGSYGRSGRPAISQSVSQQTLPFVLSKVGTQVHSHLLLPIQDPQDWKG